MLSENMASLGGEQVISKKDLSDSTTSQQEIRPSSVEKKSLIRDRDEKLRIAKERQNEERQRKIEELRAQAEAAQKYREQKDGERRRKIEELRHKDNDRRQQVEERKKAIIEAEKERREYILRKNQEREARLDTKKRNERSSIAFAFGSSTPRLLDPAELGNVSPSTYLGHRRSTSITNVAYTGAPLTRRSSERDLLDGSKKRATSAGGIDRQNDDRRRKSTSMYEVFNWGCTNDEPPKRFALSICGADIDIDGPPSTKQNFKRIYKEETATTETPPISYRSVARRKTDLMPTIPSPRESSFGSKTSLHSHTPRTPGRAVSMTRLDQLSQPIRRNGEHIRAIIERERQHQYGLMLTSSNPNTYTLNSPTTTTATTAKTKSMSRSMTHLTAAGAVNGNKIIYKNNNINNNSNDYAMNGSVTRSLRKTDTFRSMSQLIPAKRSVINNSTATSTGTTVTTKKAMIYRSTRYDRKDDAPSSLTSTGSRSGDVTPGGSINTSRPGSAMSTSTTASGLVQRRTLPPTRKPRPASIAVTGVSLNDELNKQKKDKPPLPKLQSTPKRASLSNSNSVTKISSTDSIKRSSTKKESLTPKPKQSTENKNAISKPLNFEKTDQAKESDLVSILDNQNSQTKEEKEAINAVKTESILMNNEIISVTKDYNEDIQPMAQQLIDINIEEKVTAEEKIDNDTEKDSVSQEVHVFKEPSVPKEIPESVPVPSAIPIEIRELSVERQDNEMTASMIARKITTEEQAKAALAERRKIAREEAERQAELEKQRLEAERQAEIQRIAEEEERQRKFEEETLRLAEEQRKSEEERLLQAIEEATKREEAEKLKREEDEKLKIEREEAEKKAKEEAEKQRLEVAERLKREEKEREERRKRVEAIMSRTRAKGGGNSTPNSTPTKDNDEKSDKIEDEKATNQQLDNNSQFNENENNKMEESSQIVEEISIIPQQQPQSQQDEELQKPDQTFYEKSVTEKENALMKTFSNMMIVDENSKNYQNFQNPLVEVTNGKTLSQNQKTNEIVSHSIANGNGHIENLNKNDTNTLVDISSTITDQLIDFANESQQIADVVNCNNNNSLITSSATTTLVTSDSHENKEISLL